MSPDALLCAALNADIGIVVQTPDPLKARAKLTNCRSANSMYHDICIQPGRRDTSIIYLRKASVPLPDINQLQLAPPISDEVKDDAEDN